MLSLPSNDIPPPSQSRSYTFTDPGAAGPSVPVQRKRRHTPSPGCPLCSILVNLETTASSNQTPTQNEANPDRNLHPPPPSPLVPQPASPAFPSPAVLQKPLLSSQTSQTRPQAKSNNVNDEVDGRVLLVDDDDLTAWRANRSERLATGGRHIVLVFKRHIQDVYSLGPQDIPLLSHALQTAHMLLDRAPSSGVVSTSIAGSRNRGKGKGKATTLDDDNDGDQNDLESAAAEFDDGFGAGERRVGFLTGITRDPQFPYAHLHIHATLGPLDAASWFRRTITYNSWSPGWWGLEDLIAEIRETTSNNRVKSGYGRRNAPITAVPLAGSDTGLPNALEPLPNQTNPSNARPAQTNPRLSAPNATATTGSVRSTQEQMQTPVTSDDQSVPAGLLDAVLRDAERRLGSSKPSSGAQDGRIQQESGKQKGKGKHNPPPRLKLREGGADQTETLAEVEREELEGRRTAVLEVHE